MTRLLKHNTWKKNITLLAFGLFLISFNAEGITVVKKNIINPGITFKDIEFAIITKDTSKSDLKEIEEVFKKQGVTLMFKNIKYNDNNEITSIKVSASYKDSKTKYDVSSNKPINDIEIKFDSENHSIFVGNKSEESNKHLFISEDEDSTKKKHRIKVIIKDDEQKINEDDEEYTFNFKAKEKKETVEVNVYTEEVTITKDKDGNAVKKIIKKSGNPEKENTWTKENGESIKLDDKKSKTEKRIFISSENDASPLIILDGKEVDKDKLINLLPENIKSINVLKGNTATELYGDKGKDGVIVVTSKK